MTIAALLFLLLLGGVLLAMGRSSIPPEVRAPLRTYGWRDVAEVTGMGVLRSAGLTRRQAERRIERRDLQD